MKTIEPQTIEDLVARRRTSVRMDVRVQTEWSAGGATHPGGACSRLFAVYTGAYDEQAFRFERTCAAGHDLTHRETLEHAVVIANARLRRDYRALVSAGVPCCFAWFRPEDVTDEAPAGPQARPVCSLTRAIRLVRLGEAVAPRLRLLYHVPPEHSQEGVRLCAEYVFAADSGCFAVHKTYAEFPAQEDPGEILRAMADANELLLWDRRRLTLAGLHVPCPGFREQDLALHRALHLSPLEAVPDRLRALEN